MAWNLEESSTGFVEATVMQVEDSGLRTRASLLIRIRDAGDAESWRTFVTIYAPLVYRYACRRGLQDADAADLSQDVMEKVTRAIRSFEYQPAKGRFRDWLLTITRRQIAQFHEGRARRPEKLCGMGELEEFGEEKDPPDADWNEDFNARVLQVALDRARLRFEPMTWRAFECVWLENRTAAETADTLSLHIESVYYAKSRVLKQLRDEVQEIVEDFSCLDTFGAT
jgi:RNA polymerase sigma factor (sigma-70 family)